MGIILKCRRCKSTADMQTAYHWYHIDERYFEIVATCKCGHHTILYVNVPDGSVKVNVNAKERKQRIVEEPDEIIDHPVNDDKPVVKPRRSNTSKGDKPTPKPTRKGSGTTKPRPRKRSST